MKIYLLKYCFSDQTAENYLVDLDKVKSKKVKKILETALKEESGTEDIDHLVSDFIYNQKTFPSYPSMVEGEIIIWEN